MKFEVLVVLCSLVQPAQCDTIRVKEYVLPFMPHNCMMVGYKVAARNIKRGDRVKKIKCIRPPRDSVRDPK